MNLKYYLRGLGIGITVTALILGITMGNGRETLTNEEIKERARALGMVEGSMTVAEAAAQSEEAALKQEPLEELPEETTQAAVTPEEAETPTPEATSTPESTATPAPEATPTPEPTATLAPEATSTPEATAAPTEAPTPEPITAPTEKPTATLTEAPGGDTSSAADDTAAQSVTIEVNRGEGSYAICKKLEQAGLIDDASEFDAYLCGNGYHTKLRAGAHEIPAGAAREEIAALLCK